MKILVTGANGLLGDSLSQVLGQTHEVVAVGHERLEITDLEQVRRVIAEVRPDAVIHPAGIPDPDKCEADPVLAYRVNALGTRNVALASADGKAPMVYISTDMVFDGTKGADYDEFDRTNPVNVYGRAKLAGEGFVRDFLHQHYVVRCAWLYGGRKPNFVTQVLQKARAGERIKASTEHCSTPTNVDELAQAIGRLVESGQFGTYHVTSQGYCSRFDLARLALEYAGLSTGTLVPFTQAEDRRPARRGKRTSLRNLMLEAAGFPRLEPYDVALRRYVASLQA